MKKKPTKVKAREGTIGHPNKHDLRYRNTGRPSKMTPELLGKLEEAFARGVTDSEACIYVDIAMSTLYDYCVLNPDFAEKKENLKKNLNMRAKINLHDKIYEGDKDVSKWWLERKAKEEFSLKTETEHSGEIKSKIVYIEKEEKEAYKNHINKVIDGD